MSRCGTAHKGCQYKHAERTIRDKCSGSRMCQVNPDARVEPGMSLSLKILSSSKPCQTLASNCQGLAAHSTGRTGRIAVRYSPITSPNSPATLGGTGFRSGVGQIRPVARVLCRAAEETLELSEDSVEQALQVCILLGQDMQCDLLHCRRRQT